jgi:hypothetical protein
MSVDHAEREYGVILDSATLALDDVRTAACRRERAP